MMNHRKHVKLWEVATKIRKKTFADTSRLDNKLTLANKRLESGHCKNRSVPLYDRYKSPKAMLLAGAGKVDQIVEDTRAFIRIVK